MATTKIQHTTPEGTCVICGCEPQRPYRRIVGGRITEGCVGEAHSGVTLGPTDSVWHNRPHARAIRAETRKRLATKAVIA